MGKQKAVPAAKSSQLLQFRATLELEQLVKPFADRYGLTLSAAFKDLAGLAVIGLDHRHYPLVRQLATTMGGENAFPKACVYLHAALAGAALIRGGAVLYEEPARTRLVCDVVREYLRERGVEVKVEGLWLGPLTASPQPEAGPTVEGHVQPGLSTTGPTGGEVTGSNFGGRARRRPLSKKRLEEEAGGRAGSDEADEQSG